MFRLFGLLLVGLVLAGCQMTPKPKVLSNYVYVPQKTTNTSADGFTRSASSTKALCNLATKRQADGSLIWDNTSSVQRIILALKSDGQTCGVDEPVSIEGVLQSPTLIAGLSNENICRLSTKTDSAGMKIWDARIQYKQHIQEAKRRGLSCGVGETSNTQTAFSNTAKSRSIYTATNLGQYSDKAVCNSSTISLGDGKVWADYNRDEKLKSTSSYMRNQIKIYIRWVQEAKRRGLSCGVSDTSTTQTASNITQLNTTTSAELEAERKKRIKLEQQLAALKVQQEQQQQTISNDTQIPLITIASANTKGKQGVIRGRASDNVGVAEVTAAGQPVPFDASGNFQYQTFVPTGGKDIVIEVTDVAGLTSKQTVSLTRSAGTAAAAITFDSLNPLGRRVATNKDALALIIGVDGYENTPARAIYADSDAQMFADYATEKLGIPANRIKTLVNDNADFADVLLSVREWLGRSVRQNKTDVHIFFAGHGLASDDGKKMYLLPYDGSPRLLDRTAILRDELFADISAANPRSVTVFLDTCYSGTTRGTDMLIASRPIAIRALEQSIPDNFTVMTAAAGDQTAKPLEEAKHGMFSYFLMKGMEGEADANNDNEITAGELHSYVQTNVIQQSSGSQTPELQGDADRVLVRFQ